MTDKGKILIADDEKTFLLSTAELLRQQGYECDCATDADQASEKLRQTQYDLLIADIKMPGNPRLEFIQSLSEISKGLPTILITGYPSLDTAMKSVKLPVVAYLTKPLDLPEFLANVRSAISNKRTNQAIGRMAKSVADWQNDLTQVEQVISQSSADESMMAVDTFLGLTLRNFTSCLTDLRNVTQALSTDEKRKETCQLLDCPILQRLTEGLTETIEVLENTKHSFKSKELGRLRKRLEVLVKSVKH